MDRLDDVATFELRSDGLAPVSVLVTQTDTTPDPNSVTLTFNAITDSSGAIGMTVAAAAGVSYTLEASVDFVSWTPVDTKVAADASNIYDQRHRRSISILSRSPLVRMAGDGGSQECSESRIFCVHAYIFTK